MATPAPVPPTPSSVTSPPPAAVPSGGVTAVQVVQTLRSNALTRLVLTPSVCDPSVAIADEYRLFFSKHCRANASADAQAEKDLEVLNTAYKQLLFLAVSTIGEHDFVAIHGEALLNRATQSLQYAYDDIGRLLVMNKAVRMAVAAQQKQEEEKKTTPAPAVKKLATIPEEAPPLPPGGPSLAASCCTNCKCEDPKPCNSECGQPCPVKM